MDCKKKKIYQKPSLLNVSIDRDVLLLQASENTLPGGGGGFGVSSYETTSSSTDEETTPTSTKENNFDENPFER